MVSAVYGCIKVPANQLLIDVVRLFPTIIWRVVYGLYAIGAACIVAHSSSVEMLSIQHLGLFVASQQPVRQRTCLISEYRPRECTPRTCLSE